MAILKLTAQLSANASLSDTPAELSKSAYKAVSQITGDPDPYAQEKIRTNQAVMQILPRLQQITESSSDPLSTAIHIAVAGNIIDLGIGHNFDLNKDIDAIIQMALAIDDTESLRAQITPGIKILYLGDNAGEIVLDTILVNWLKQQGANLTFSVKSGPIINDATIHDARFAGLTDMVEVIETGSDDIGVNWNNVSDQFRKTFESANIIISKGHGNFETCDTRPENIYFLLKTKCQLVASELNVPLGSIVFKHNNH